MYNIQLGAHKISQSKEHLLPVGRQRSHQGDCVDVADESVLLGSGSNHPVDCMDRASNRAMKDVVWQMLTSCQDFPHSCGCVVRTFMQ